MALSSAVLEEVEDIIGIRTVAYVDDAVLLVISLFPSMLSGGFLDNSRELGTNTENIELVLFRIGCPICVFYRIYS